MINVEVGKRLHLTHDHVENRRRKSRKKSMSYNICEHLARLRQTNSKSFLSCVWSDFYVCTYMCPFSYAEHNSNAHTHTHKHTLAHACTHKAQRHDKNKGFFRGRKGHQGRKEKPRKIMGT